jgi:hypothetical protein
MKKIILSTLCAGILAIPVMAEKFDGSRQGLVVGLGLGLASVSTNVEYDYPVDYKYRKYGELKDRNVGMTTSFKIGYGFNEEFSIYYTNQIDWYTFDGSSTRVALNGVGVDYYLDGASPFFGTAMIGFGTIFDAKDNKSSTGAAMAIGVGYDIAPHMSVVTTYMHVSKDEEYDDGSTADIDTDSIQLKFQYTWY